MFKQLNAIDVSKINIKENCINYMHDEKALENNPESGSEEDGEKDPHDDVQYYDNIKELQDQILQHTQKYQEIYDSVKTKSSQVTDQNLANSTNYGFTPSQFAALKA
jgi:hypothetical protein